MQGAQLEPDLGSGRFLALVLELLTLSHLATVGLAAGAARLAPDLAGAQYFSGCAIGFSAVLFALKVVLSYRTPGWSTVCGISLPTKVGGSPLENRRILCLGALQHLCTRIAQRPKHHADE